ncbi:MAG: MarR family transcriptional regulator [Phycisphaerae bacterium]|nr:MarR family transcriptional regulator [Phycisphaerae bacterium]
MGNSDNHYQERVLLAMRRIMRQVDIYSRKINDTFKVTVPQLLCLYSLQRCPEQSMSQLAKDVSLGTSTVNGIADRLEVKGLVKRRRSQKDRRKVFLDLTEKGKALVLAAPPMLQETLADELNKLPELEQATIALSLERVVKLMEAEHIDASPNLLNDSIVEQVSTADVNY